MKYYTYKVTFEDLPGYFYYGFHKDNGKPYSGSPVTWRCFWEQFQPEVQVLQWYNTYEDAKNSEESILRATWKSAYSLNENCGGRFSEEVHKKNGIKALESESGIHNPEYRNSEEYKKMLSDNGRKTGEEMGKEVGQRAVEEKRGIHNPEYKESEEFKIHRSNNGRKVVEEQLGIYNPKNKQILSDNGKSSTSQKWMCVMTGFVSSPGGLSMYQKSRGIDTNLRRRLD